jgi:hypothetical protein
VNGDWLFFKIANRQSPITNAFAVEQAGKEKK